MANTDSEVKKLAENVSSLQQDMAQVGSLVDRLDVTIEKLTEVSTTVSQLLAVQGNRLEFQEKIAEKLQDLVEKRRIETEGYVKDLHVKIDSVERDLKADIKDTHLDILGKIGEMQESGKQQHQDISDKLSERITSLEKWMWTIAGGGTVVWFIISQIDFTKFFS